MELILLQENFGVCRLGAQDPLPAWASECAWVSMTRTGDELAVVCPEESVPPDVRCEPGWQALRVAGTLDFSQVGVLASLVSPLAEAGVSVFVVSTFDTDYLLVKSANVEKAAAALRAHGHTVRR
jgi:hypothetical protein